MENERKFFQSLPPEHQYTYIFSQYNDEFSPDIQKHIDVLVQFPDRLTEYIQSSNKSPLLITTLETDELEEDFPHQEGLSNLHNSHLGSHQHMIFRLADDLPELSIKEAATSQQMAEEISKSNDSLAQKRVIDTWIRSRILFNQVEHGIGTFNIERLASFVDFLIHHEARKEVLLLDKDDFDNEKPLDHETQVKYIKNIIVKHDSLQKDHRETLDRFKISPLLEKHLRERIINMGEYEPDED